MILYNRKIGWGENYPIVDGKQLESVSEFLFSRFVSEDESGINGGNVV